MRLSLMLHAGAIAFLCLAVTLRYLFDPVLQDSMPMMTLFGAVAAAVWMAGVPTGILMAILGFLAGHLLFTSSPHPGRRPESRVLEAGLTFDWRRYFRQARLRGEH